jgi:hypothetical protein
MDETLPEQVTAAIRDAMAAGCHVEDLDVPRTNYLGEVVRHYNLGVRVIGEDGPHCVTLTMAGFTRETRPDRRSAWVWVRNPLYRTMTAWAGVSHAKAGVLSPELLRQSIEDDK